MFTKGLGSDSHPSSVQVLPYMSRDFKKLFNLSVPNPPCKVEKLQTKKEHSLQSRDFSCTSP